MDNKEKKEAIDDEELNRRKKEVADLIEKAKGKNRSYADYAKLTGVSTASFSRMKKGDYLPSPKTTRNLTSEAADPQGGVTYDEMMRAIEEDEEYIARADESCDEFFDNYGMDRPRAPLQALGRLRDSVRETEKLKKELDDAVSRKEEYERDHDVSKLNGADFGDALSLEALNSEAKQIKEEIENNRRALKQQESDYNTAIEKQGIMDDDAEELQRQEEEQAALKHKYDIALKAAGFLERAKESFSSKYMDEIKESFDKYHDRITDSPDKYELDANLNILLREAGATHDIRSLSEGYQDLVGLCRRMAMIDAMYDMEKPFLIFDDPFVNLDEKRLEGAMGFLEKISHDYQIIYFSCHESRCG